jgi:putative transposase
VDNGPEFIAERLSDWCKNNNVELTFIQPGKPAQNGNIERFNRSFREEVLSMKLFT